MRTRVINYLTISFILTIFFSLLIGTVGLENALAQSKGKRTLKLATLYSEGQELFETVRFFTSEIEKRTNIYSRRAQ